MRLPGSRKLGLRLLALGEKARKGSNLSTPGVRTKVPKVLACGMGLRDRDVMLATPAGAVPAQEVLQTKIVSPQEVEADLAIWIPDINGALGSLFDLHGALRRGTIDQVSSFNRMALWRSMCHQRECSA